MSTGLGPRVLRWVAGAAVGLVMVGASSAYAVPLLQVYLEGAEYNTATESWRLIGSPGSTARLWAIGNLGKPNQSTIYDVRLIASFNDPGPASLDLTGARADGDGSITFTGSGVVEGGSLTIEDDTTPSNETATDVTANLLGNGKLAVGSFELPSHGVLGPNRTIFEYALGDFDTKEADLANFSGCEKNNGPGVCTLEMFEISSFAADAAQINVYEFTIPLTGIADWHFDLVGFKDEALTQGTKAPFSHDGEGAIGIPEPTTLALFGFGLAALGLAARRRRLN